MSDEKGQESCFHSYVGYKQQMKKQNKHLLSAREDHICCHPFLFWVSQSPPPQHPRPFHQITGMQQWDPFTQSEASKDSSE